MDRCGAVRNGCEREIAGGAGKSAGAKETMKWWVRSLLIVVAAGIGLAIGSVWKRGRGIEGAPQSAASVHGVAERAGGTADRARAKASDDSPLATQLEHSLSMSSGVRRWLYWLEAIEKATVNDFPRLAMLARNDPAALRFLGARWVEIAPRHLFDTLVKASGDRRFPWRTNA